MGASASISHVITRDITHPIRRRSSPRRSHSMSRLFFSLSLFLLSRFGFNKFLTFWKCAIEIELILCNNTLFFIHLRVYYHLTHFYPHNHTAETIKPNEIYHLKSGKIEMIRGQMRLMTDRKTYDKSAVAPVAPGEVSLLPPEADVPKAKDCGAMDLSVLFFERIQ